MITKEQIYNALQTVEEPDLKKDLVTLGMIQDLRIESNQVYFTIVLTTPACPLKELIKKNCIEAIHHVVDEKIEVIIHFTSNVTSLRHNQPILPRVKNIIAIASGKGGVGKSTVTTNLAIALHQQGAKVGIIDADIFGPSIPVMFNCEDSKPGIYQQDGKNYIIPIEQYGIKLLSIGFLTPAESAVVWRGPMASSALKQFIADADWGELDYLLVDLPPGTSDIHLTLVQTVSITGVVIVTTPQKVALADAKKGLAMFKQGSINVPILGIVENMSYFIPEELPTHRYYIFGKGGGQELATQHQVPLLAQIPLVQSIRESGDDGKPVLVQEKNSMAHAFMELAQNLAQQVAIRNASLEKTKIVEIKS